ncbi:MAG: hypothetical protein MUF84_07030, partial [Anaerolineae bacterium]|nr:hypothetical protein [Anaerolineae bacterium]
MPHGVVDLMSGMHARHLRVSLLRVGGLLMGLLLASLLALPAPSLADTPAPHLGYGFMLAYPPGSLSRVSDAGFDWFKYFVYWNAVDGNRDRIYNWDTVNWRLDEACSKKLNLLLRVERDSQDWTPIQDSEMAGWQAFFEDLAAHIAEKQTKCSFAYRVALEVWNEPNLDFQWGLQPVDPVRYTAMVTRAYSGARAGDLRILVVAGSLAPTGGLPEGRAMNDVAYLEAMYAAGLKGHFDAISIHNYGFGGAPEDKAWGSGILNFRRAEDIRAVMVARGDGALPVWATEFGWLLESATCTPYWQQIGFAWQQVTAAQQADYLSRAFAYADAEWPWMGVMVVSNLDFSTMPWYASCDPLRYFSVLNADGSPRPAYTALAQMTKRPRSWEYEVWGMATSPNALGGMQVVTDTHIVTQTVQVVNTGTEPF